jgi:NAD dependent epimerase/dehydratase family enzyme
MTTFHFQTHVSDSGVITLPPLPLDFYGEDVVVNIDMDDQPKRKSFLDEICGGWEDDERATEEIIREIYESRKGAIMGHRSENS